jgi:hypothetical protein
LREKERGKETFPFDNLNMLLKMIYMDNDHLCCLSNKRETPVNQISERDSEFSSERERPSSDLCTLLHGPEGRPLSLVAGHSDGFLQRALS